MPRFRLLHVTDLHIGIPPEDNRMGQRTVWRCRESLYPSCANSFALEAIAEFVHQHRNEFDLVLVSGDVADDGIQRNLDSAFRFITSPPSKDWYSASLLPTLDATRSSGPPFFVLPGNHDRFRGLGRLPGGTYFDRTFSGFWKVGLGGIQTVLLRKAGVTLALIGADFCLQKLRDATIHLGQGRAYRRVVERLIQTSVDLRAKHTNIGIAWITHFPPLLDVDHTLELLESERLLEAARDNSVRYVISGHLHRNQHNSYSDVEVICTGSASSAGAGELYGNWICGLDVEVERSGRLSISKESFEYRAEEAAFENPVVSVSPNTPTIRVGNREFAGVSKKLGSRVLDILPDMPDIRDRIYLPHLRSLYPGIYPRIAFPVRDQGKDSSCTGFALAHVIDFLRCQDIGPDRPEPVSSRMLYEMAKRNDEWDGTAYEGSSLRGAIKGFYQNGVCTDATAPDGPRIQDWALTYGMAKEARETRLGAYFRLQPDISDYHAALNEIGVIYASAQIHSHWENPKDDLIEPGGDPVGGHAFAIVGYDDTGFWVLNSWGPDWGVNGVAKWIYADWANTIMDAWALQLKARAPDVH